MNTNEENKHTPSNNKLHNDNPKHNSQEEGISDEQIERGELSQNKVDQETGEKNHEVSRTNIDPSKSRKGNVGVSPASITEREAHDIENETRQIKGGNDAGKGRASGADKP